MTGPLYLAIDVGNSHTQFGVMRGREVVSTFRITTQRRSTDELGVLLLSLLQHRGVTPTDLSSAITSCVVPGVLYGLEKAVRRYLDVELMIVGRGLKSGLRIRTDNPRELGSDRLVNAVAAKARWSGPLIVVDLGTATLFDCVDAAGDYVGGSIAPGFHTSQSALEASNARLPSVAIAPPPHPIGRNTLHALQSGMVYGFAGLVDGIARRCREQLGGTARIIATGEWSQLIGPASDEIDEVAPWLTLDGLAVVHDKNRA